MHRQEFSWPGLRGVESSKHVADNAGPSGLEVPWAPVGVGGSGAAGAQGSSATLMQVG